MRNTGLTYEFLGADAVHKQYAQARMGTRDRGRTSVGVQLQALGTVEPVHWLLDGRLVGTTQTLRPDARRIESPSPALRLTPN